MDDRVGARLSCTAASVSASCTNIRRWHWSLSSRRIPISINSPLKSSSYILANLLELPFQHLCYHRSLEMDLFTFTAELARNGNVVSIDQGDSFCTGTSSFHCCDHPRCTIQVPHTLIDKRSGSGWKCPSKGCNNEYTFRIVYPSTAPSGAATSPNEELSALGLTISDFHQSVENRFEHIEPMIKAMHESFKDRNHQGPNLSRTTSSTCGSAGGGASEASVRVLRKKVDELHQLINDSTRDMSTMLMTAKQIKEAVDQIAASNDQIFAIIRGFGGM